MLILLYCCRRCGSKFFGGTTSDEVDEESEERACRCSPHVSVASNGTGSGTLMSG